MTILRFSFLLLACLITGLSPANAQDLLQTRLIAERGYVEGGETIKIGIEQSIAPHWHTYWKNPGDSGTQTSIKWTLPEGFEISPIIWPTPKKIPYPPLLNYGYEENAILLQTLQIPEDIGSEPITLTASIETLVCKEECIPVYGTHTLVLNGPESRSEDNTAYFKAAEKKLPLALASNAAYSEEGGNFILSIDLGEDITTAINTDTVAFFPQDWGLIQNPAPLSAAVDGKTLTITQPRGERGLYKLADLNAVITYETKNGAPQSIEITATKGKTANTADKISGTLEISVIKALLFALIGGLILNLMPCVFPVLSIKALSLIKIAAKHPELARKHGVAYTLGVVLSFMSIAAILLALKHAGAYVGWGFQLQNPGVITGLAILMFAIGMNLIGFFELKSSFGNFGGKLAQGDGLSGSFFTGVLATLVASPCTAPFMAGAIGFALTQPAAVNLAIFASLGFGLALPYLLLSFIPALQRVMPKPGTWMIKFRIILSVPIFLSALWLLWVLDQQTDYGDVLFALAVMGVLTLTIWGLNYKESTNKKQITILAATLLSLAALGTYPLFQHERGAVAQSEAAAKETFSYKKLETLLDGDNPIFVEMTAAWCITCKVNHAIGINTDQTRKTFNDYNVTFLIGDWTNQDPEITKYLNSYGRNGVPIYVYYGARKNGARPEPVILPQILKPDTISNLIEQDHE